MTLGFVNHALGTCRGEKKACNGLIIFAICFQPKQVSRLQNQEEHMHHY